MGLGTVDLKVAIKSKLGLEKQINGRVQGLRQRLKKEEQFLTETQVERATLEAALAILQKRKKQPDTVQITAQPPVTKDPAQYSVTVLGRMILAEQGRPMSINELHPILNERRKKGGESEVSRDAMSGVLYRKAKNGKFFKLVKPGTIGLIQ